MAVGFDEIGQGFFAVAEDNEIEEVGDGFAAVGEGAAADNEGIGFAAVGGACGDAGEVEQYPMETFGAVAEVILDRASARPSTPMF